MHVRFISHDASDKTYFVAGQARTTCTNRILAMVRTSGSRSKADFDKLAERIEEAWHDALKGAVQDEGKNKGRRPGEVDETARDAEATRLLMVVFYPMLAAREAGMVIPEAGQEGPWLKENVPHFREMSEAKGLDDFTDMLKELEEREDLKKLVA